MESSPESNHPPVDARDAKVLADIDLALAEYDRTVLDHRLALEGIVIANKELPDQVEGL